MNTQLNMAQLVAELPDTTLTANWADDFLAQLTLAVCHTNSTGHFVDVNDAYCVLYGYTQEELIGQHFSMVIPEGYRAVATGIHDAFISGVDEHPGEWTVVNKLGQHMRINVTTIRLQDENGNSSKITLIEKIDD